jgi:hypothetical protein
MKLQELMGFLRDQLNLNILHRNKPVQQGRARNRVRRNSDPYAGRTLREHSAPSRRIFFAAAASVKSAYLRVTKRRLEKPR